MKLLIVDDEEGMRRTLRRIMLAKGHTVEVAASGEEAIELAPVFQPDCILLDIRMPGLNGVETFRELKQICPNAFAIFMTAYAASSLTTEAREQGGIEVFSKPLDPDSVCDLIQKTAEQRPVLIVDDDAGFRESLERVLVTKGFKVHSAATIPTAVEQFYRCPRGIVLLDMNLDGGSGLDVLETIRETNPEVFTVLMTGYSDLLEQMEEGLAAGGSCSYTKPFNIDELLAAIESNGKA
ncbi:MAG: response regulator [Planctomycetaceae bacterium]